MPFFFFFFASPSIPGSVKLVGGYPSPPQEEQGTLSLLAQLPGPAASGEIALPPHRAAKDEAGINI